MNAFHRQASHAVRREAEGLSTARLAGMMARLCRRLGSGLLAACLLVAPTLGDAGDEGFPTFYLSVQPNPVYHMQEVRVRLTGPGCYGFFSSSQYPHLIEIDGSSIHYSLPMGIGVQPIGCTNALVTSHFPVGQFPAGSYQLTVSVYSPNNGNWNGLIELGTVQFEVLPNLAVTQAQVVPAGNWVSLLALGGVLLLVGGLVLVGRVGRL